MTGEGISANAAVVTGLLQPNAFFNVKGEEEIHFSQCEHQLTNWLWEESPQHPRADMRSIITLCISDMFYQIPNVIGPLECDKQRVCPITFQVLPSLYKCFI